MKNATFRVWLCALFCIAVSAFLPKQAMAQLFTENFNYGGTAGNLVGKGGWSGIGSTVNTGTFLQYVPNANLSFGSYGTVGGKVPFASLTNAEDAGRRMATTPFASGTVYVSLLVNFSVVNPTEDYFFALNNSPTGTTYPARIYVKSNGSGGVSIGLRKASTSTTAYSPTAYTLNTTYLIVLKYNIVGAYVATPISTDDECAMFIFASGDTFTTEPTVPSVVSTGNDFNITVTGTGMPSGGLASVALRQGSGTLSGEIDYIRMADTWANVTNVPNTPSTLTPSITTIPDFGNVANGAFSAVANYQLTGTNLINDVLCTASTNFQVSKDGTNFGTTVSYTTAELATPKNVYVRFAPASGMNGLKTGTITQSSYTAIDDVIVNVSGTETGNTVVPTLVANPTSLTFPATNNGATSATQTYTLTGTNLTANVTVAVVAPFEVSKDGTTFAQSFDYTSADLTTPKTVTVRFKPTSGINGAKNATITHSGFTGTNVAVTGEETGNVAIPTLVATPTSLTFPSTNNGATSATQTYTLTGTNLTANVTVAVVAPFEISKDGTTFVQSFDYTSADLSTQKTVTVRFKPTSGINGAKNATITHSGFANTHVAVSGTEAGNSTNIVVNPTTLTSFGNVTEGDVSAIKTYTLTVNNPSADFAITAPTHFQVSKDGTTFASSINILLAEQANPLTISVRFVPVLNSSDGFKTGNITHAGFTNTVGVSGNKVFTQVVLISSITGFGNVNTGSNSASQVYTMQVTNPSASGVTVTAPAHFQVSKDNITFAQSITYTPAELTNAVFPKIRFSPTSGINGLRFGKVTHSFTTVGENVQGTETGNALSSTLTANPTTLNNFGSVNNGEISTVQTYTLTAANLVYNVTVSVANVNNFQVSKDGTAFASSINYTIAELATPQTVSVRFRPTSGINGAKTDFIAHSGFASTNVNVAGTEAGNAATLTTSTNTVNSFGDVNNGATSSIETYTLSGTNLTENVTVAIPAPFEVSKDGTTFSNSIEYTGAELATFKIVRVRFKPTSGINGTKFGTITHSGFPNRNVSTSGTEIGNLPTLTANATTLTFGNTNKGANSAPQTYTLTGANLTSDVTVTAPANFQVSKDGTAFSTSIIYTIADFNSSSTQTVSVRFSPTSGTDGAKSGTITHSSFANTNVAVSGTETGNIPTIQTSLSTLTFGATGTNQASAIQTYTLSVNNTVVFTAGITVTAPTHFEVSKDGTTFSNTLSYTLADMANTQTVRVRFKPTGASDGTRTGNITHTSTGVTAVNVGVTGTESLALAVETWANDFNISPNPTRGDLRLRCDAPARWIGADITFTDLAGKEVGKHIWANPAQPLQLNMLDLKKGTYLVRITAGKQSVVRKVVML